jgi:UDP-2-acetamido-2,6-beta-L-arabino-hexul-4-ose reductase
VTGRAARIAVTGAGGFLGWHVRCRAFAAGVGTVPLRRADLADPTGLAAALSDVDAVVHCAGVNRGTDSELVEGNLAAARTLADALRRVDRPVRVVYANSVRARGDDVYGAAKRKAAELLAGAAPDRFWDVLLPNLFGEHGRPYYNSFVATFCRELADGREPAEVRDREVSLLAAPDAAELLLQQALGTGTGTGAGHGGGAGVVVAPGGRPVRVAEVLATLREFVASYAGGEIPELSDRFRTRLFHTYQSHLFPDRYPVVLPRRTDPRGSLVEWLCTSGGGGAAFVSSTLPGAVRGEHVHLRKFERFVVVDGQAEIALRRLFTGELVRFRVAGEAPAIVDIPTMWTHRLTNLDDRPITTLFWTNEPLVAGDADTYPCPVDGRSECAP